MKKILFTFCVALSLSLTAPAIAARYKTDNTTSTLAFSGTHADTPFTGKFEHWQADIAFDPAKLSESHIHVVIHTASAKTGDRMYDGTLPTADWFAAENFPTATFKSTAIRANTDGSYTAEGNLTIRDMTKPVSFTFTLKPEELTGGHVTTRATLTLDRLAFDIGAKSDPNAEWVSRDIALVVDLMAVRE